VHQPQQDALAPLMQKIKDGDLDGLRQLIKTGAQVDADTLTYAVEIDAGFDIIQELWRANRNAVFETDRNGENALTLAVRKNFAKAELFLHNGTFEEGVGKFAPPRLNPHFEEALCLAAKNGFQEVMQRLTKVAGRQIALDVTIRHYDRSENCRETLKVLVKTIAVSARQAKHPETLDKLLDALCILSFKDLDFAAKLLVKIEPGINDPEHFLCLYGLNQGRPIIAGKFVDTYRYVFQGDGDSRPSPDPKKLKSVTAMIRNPERVESAFWQELKKLDPIDFLAVYDGRSTLERAVMMGQNTFDWVKERLAAFGCLTLAFCSEAGRGKSNVVAKLVSALAIGSEPQLALSALPLLAKDTEQSAPDVLFFRFRDAGCHAAGSGDADSLENCLEAIDGLAQLVQDSQRIADECRGAIVAASLKQ
jgi:hypothetical protein